jgi:hypothetical protein
VTTVAHTAIDRLRDVLRNMGEDTRMDRGDSFRTRGICHDGDDPETVSVRRVAGKVNIRCHKCDGDDDFLNAIGWTARDLYDEPREGREGRQERPTMPPKPRPKPTAPKERRKAQRPLRGEVTAYPYCDEAGTLLYEVVRVELPGEDKTFRQIAADGSFGIDGVRRVLYRLPHVLEVAQAGGIVMVVEGEKDADNLAAIGMCATTTTNGAKSEWLPEYTQAFKGAGQAVVVADNDEVGRSRALKVTGILRAAGINARAVLPAVNAVKADVTDHLQAGYGFDDLVPLDAPAPAAPATWHDHERQAGPTDAGLNAVRPEPGTREWDGDEQHDRADAKPRITFRKASTIKLKRTEWLWDTTKEGATPHTEGRIPHAMLSVLAGLPGTGKSQFAVYLTAKLTRGTLPGCYYGKPMNVVYAATEDDWERTIAPRLVAAGADMDRVFQVEVSTAEHDGVRLNVATQHAELCAQAEADDVAAIVFDPLLSHIGGDINANAESEVRAALEPLVKSAAKHGVTIIGLSHFNKGSGTDPMERLMGSRGFSALLRALIVFSRDKDAEEEGPARFVLSQAKSNLGRTDIPSYSYTLVNTVVELEEGGQTHVPRFVLGPESGTSVEKQLEQAAQPITDVESAKDCAQWLEGRLTDLGGSDARKDIIKAGRVEGYSESTLERTKKKLRITSRQEGFGKEKTAYWCLPGA